MFERKLNTSRKGKENRRQEMKKNKLTAVEKERKKVKRNQRRNLRQKIKRIK